MGLEEDFVYPLILLAIGSAVTFALGTTIPQRYQEKQRKQDLAREEYRSLLEKKHEIIQQILDMVAEFDISINNSLASSGKERTEKIKSATNLLWKQNLKITGFLSTFFPEKMAMEWVECGQMMITLLMMLRTVEESPDSLEKDPLVTKLMNRQTMEQAAKLNYHEKAEEVKIRAIRYVNEINKK